MSHIINHQYNSLGKSENWNNATYNIIPTGFYTDTTLTKVSDIQVSISAFTAHIQGSTKELSVRIENDAIESGIAVSSVNDYVVVRLTWVNSVSNDFTILGVAVGDILSTDLIVGQCNFTVTTLTGFDYTSQNISVLKNDGAEITNMFINGSGAPSSTPIKIGQKYIDTTGNREYYAVATSSSADWRKVGITISGIIIITPGGGDHTENLDVDWSGGRIVLHNSDVASDYFGIADNYGSMSVSSYEALTDVGYTDRQSSRLVYRDGVSSSERNIINSAKSVNVDGIFTGATATSFTINDDGVNTQYIEYFITA